MDMLDKRLNDRGKNWRHVLKALKVLDYCLHEGSELVVTWAAKNIYIIKTLREFQHIDEDGRDVGQNGKQGAWNGCFSSEVLTLTSACICERAHVLDP
jgi:epsin